MEPEYNWNVILRSSLPIAIIMALIFFTNIKINLKWFYLILSLVITYFVVYYQDKKKHNIFTAIMIVILVSLIVYGLKNLGLF